VRQKTRDDPASLALRMPYLQSRLKAWEEAKASGDAGSMTKTYNNLLRGLEAEQNRRGIPKDQQRVLPNEMAEDVARGILNAEPAKMLDKLRAAKADHGEYADGMAKQIGHFLPETLKSADTQQSKLMGELLWRRAVTDKSTGDLLPNTPTGGGALHGVPPPAMRVAEVGSRRADEASRIERDRPIAMRASPGRATLAFGESPESYSGGMTYGGSGPPPKEDDETLSYDDRDFATIHSYRDKILWASRQLGVDPAAVAGTIAEELDDSRQRGWAHQALNDGAKWLDQRWHGAHQGHPFGMTHEDIIREYDAYEADLKANPAMEEDVRNSGELGLALKKARYGTMIDVGPGKIRLHTAIRMLREYNGRFKDSDPLDLKKYNNAYDKLLSDLGSTESPATAAFAALMVDEATRWFKAKAPTWWAGLKPEEQAGLIVDYYNLGRETIAKRYQEHMRQDGKYEPGLGESGRRHQSNAVRIHHELYL
jgi:hypothetical protein